MVKVAITGLTASGKSYYARRLAKTFGLRYVSGSETLLCLAGVCGEGVHFWVSTEGLRFNSERSRDKNLDKKADRVMLDIARNQKDVVFDSWTLPWIYKEADLFTIYLDEDLNTRAKMAYASHEEKPYSLEKLRERIRGKDEYSINLFRELYGIDVTETSKFDLVLRGYSRKPDDTFRKIVRELTKRE